MRQNNNSYEHIEFDMPPIYNSRSRVLLLGTMPSPKSRETGFHYGHPQNRFWPVMAAVFGESLPETIKQKTALMLERRVALWNVLRACDIKGAADSSIRNPVANDFGPLFETADIRAVFGTGQTAAKLYKKLVGPDIVALPSTSPANCAIKFDELVARYRAILEYLD